MQTKNIFIFMLVTFALLWLFLSKSDPSENVSQPNVVNSLDSESRAAESSSSQATNFISNELPQPSQDNSIKIVKVSEIKQPALDDRQRKAAQTKFDQATQYATNQQWQKAEKSYLDLIETLPNAIEPYINLSAVYAATNRMDEAREILLVGVNANPNFAQLFANLQKIHGALAAEAYRAALASDEDAELLVKTGTLEIDLPMLDSLNLRNADLNQIQELEKALVSAKPQASADDTAAQRLAELEAQIKQQDQRLALQASQLKQKTEALASVEQELYALQQEATASLASVVEPVISQTVNDIANNSADAALTTNEQAQQEKYDIALNLVKQWAGSWSQQDVASYVSHYAQNYSPPRTQLSHQDWLEQRQVRLTNKKFIQIDVTDVEYQNDDDNRFSVTFTQRYRSNTIDDTIRKRLVFASSNDSMLDAKIVDEVIVQN
ncbi:MAG: hypothetical protein KTR16_15685 [Acidiferrobacterales bacterium]|nr:hypothetical protein [Acidiferrobacterales bacterium]